MAFRRSELERIRWDEWELAGRRTFLCNCLRLLGKYKKSNRVLPNIMKGLPRQIYDLFHNGIYGNLKVEQIIDVCQRLVVNEDQIPPLILDILNIFDAQTSLQPQSESRKRMGKLCKSLEPILSKQLLLERMELETLGEFKIVTTKSFYTKFIKIKTKLYYKQNKFNLYREESEGYAKLISELNQNFNGLISHESVLENIKSLIGCFNLDPTRVLDVMLDSFEANPHLVEFYSQLITSFLPDKKLLCEVLGFRYSTHRTNGVNPKSLNILTALMIQEKILNVENVYPWLTPDDELIFKELEESLAHNPMQDRRSTIVSIKENPDISPQITDETYKLNQKLGLCEAFLELGDWQGFKSVIEYMPTEYVMKHLPIAKAVCKMLHYIIDPIYRCVNGLGDHIPPSRPDFHPSIFTPKQATCICELKKIAFPIISELGASLHYDPVLIFKIVRICIYIVNKLKRTNCFLVDERNTLDTGLAFDIITVIDDALLPSLCYLHANCCVAETIWNLMKLFPLNYRYSMYSSWTHYAHCHQFYIKKCVRSRLNIKSCMKRVSKENVKQVGRAIGKIAHYSPSTLFDYIIVQIQMYDNLIAPVVDSLKYLNNMAYDMLGFCIINSLTYDDDRTKYEGNSLAQWFQSTASFCATVYKKYNIELTGLLHYLVNQLEKNESIDLLILKELVNKMAGIEVTDDITDRQLEALAGGDLLKNEAGYFVQPRNTKKSAIRLRDALEECKMISTLSIMIAQERNRIAFNYHENGHLKFIGKLFDECHDTLLHFQTFLAGPVVRDAYRGFPSFCNLLTKYNLGLDMTFSLLRPLIIKKTAEKHEEENFLLNRTFNMENIFDNKYETAYVDILFESVYNSALHLTCVDGISHLEDISTELIAFFWIMTTSDVHCPIVTYEAEVKRTRLLLTSSVHKSKKEIERLHSIIEKLDEEKERHIAHVRCIWDRMYVEKENWFASRSQKPAKNEIITVFLELCIFPRIMLSAQDAMYAANFIKILHDLQTPNFSTLLCYDRLFCDITHIVTSCTENEANRYGRFLCSVLQCVMQWHADKGLYDMFCANTPGFVTKFRGSNEFSEPNDKVHFENYRHVCHKWHYKITKSISGLLESKEYVKIRNAIIVLMRILPEFPVISRLAQFIEKRINKVKEEEKNNRPDLFALATSYSGQLITRLPFMKKESDFHVVGPNDDSLRMMHGSVTIENTSDPRTVMMASSSMSFNNTYHKIPFLVSHLECPTHAHQVSNLEEMFKETERVKLTSESSEKHKPKATGDKSNKGKAMLKKVHYPVKSYKRKSSSPDHPSSQDTDEETTEPFISPILLWKSSSSEIVTPSLSPDDKEPPQDPRLTDASLRKSVYQEYEKQKSLLVKERKYRHVKSMLAYSDDDKLSDGDSWGYDSYLPLSKDETLVKHSVPSCSGMISTKKVSTEEPKRRKVESFLRPTKTKVSSKQTERLFNEKLGEGENPIKKGRSIRKTRLITEDKERKERKVTKKRGRIRPSKLPSLTTVLKRRKELDKAKSKSTVQQTCENGESTEKKRQYKDKELVPRDPRLRAKEYPFVN